MNEQFGVPIDEPGECAEPVVFCAECGVACPMLHTTASGYLCEACFVRDDERYVEFWEDER